MQFRQSDTTAREEAIKVIQEAIWSPVRQVLNVNFAWAGGMPGAPSVLYMFLNTGRRRSR